MQAERNQVSINHHLQKWTTFDIEHRRLIEEFDALELNVRTEHDTNIEDSLDKLENVCPIYYLYCSYRYLIKYVYI